MFSVFNPSKCTHLEQWAADTAALGEQLGVQCFAQGSHLSRGQFLPEPRYEPTTSDYKSNALFARPRLPSSFSSFYCHWIGMQFNFRDYTQRCNNIITTYTWTTKPNQIHVKHMNEAGKTIKCSSKYRNDCTVHKD